VISQAIFHKRRRQGAVCGAGARVLYAVQEPFQKALLTGGPRRQHWRSKPSFYAVSTEDRTINPDLKRFMAKRMGAKTIELKSSHLSLRPKGRRTAPSLMSNAQWRTGKRRIAERELSDPLSPSD
jgi:hypothetical protein